MPLPTAQPNPARWRIGEAARRSGVSSANMRYYEKEGLLSPGGREDNSYRLYSEADVHRLRFIRLCRAMDMSLGEVRALLALDTTEAPLDIHTACHTLDGHLEHVRTRLQELQAISKLHSLVRHAFHQVWRKILMEQDALCL